MSFAASRGGIVCGSCLGEEPGARPLSDSAARLLTSMSTSAGETPPEAGTAAPDADVPAVVRDEISDTLMSFLEEHAGRELKLKSLDFLAQIKRTGQHPVESEQENEG